ncbi:MAG: peptidogalycan biosysnthesis protein, partial [Paracoccaceae bacterium]|nr:peptidogalycan biosysnthesis protein [Paracoccaceae bacterium]
MSRAALRVEIISSLSEIGEKDWDSCACPEAETGRALDPFTTHRFLKALEDSGSVGSGTGWEPYYLTLYQDEMLIGCAPMYLKLHSQGEYIFDHNWAHAYEQAGGRYYPKLQLAVPFTPATGRRFLVRPEHRALATSALIQAVQQFAQNNKLSSAHITFCTA